MLSIKVFCVLLSLIFTINCVPLANVVNPINQNLAYWNKINQEEIQETLNYKSEIKNKAKNVILFLGDGMGVATVTAARIFKAQRESPRLYYGEETYLAFERFPNLALVKTYNTDRTTPDSAATATAYLTGVKGNMGTIGVDNSVLYSNCSSYQKSSDTTSILIEGLKAGKSVGLVTTTRVTHATPAGTYASTPDREWESDTRRNVNVESSLRQNCPDIAQQMIERGGNFNVILGGGRSMFLPQTVGDPIYPDIMGKRSDGRNLLQEWLENHQKQNRRVARVYTRTQLKNTTLENYDYLLGLFAPGHLAYDEERIKNGNDEPTIEEMTEVAIKILRKNPKGYILLVEGGRIDHAHHETKARFALSETVTFEAAILKAKLMTDVNETLTMVTADHSHVFTIGGYTPRGKDVLGESQDVGTEYYLADDKLPFLSLTYANGPGALINQTRANLTGVDTTVLNYKFPALVPMADETHGGEEVAVYAQGPWAHLFHRTHEQTHVATVARYAACFPPFDKNSQCKNAALKVERFGLLSFLLPLFVIYMKCGF